jgi:hypothetical protein
MQTSVVHRFFSNPCNLAIYAAVLPASLPCRCMPRAACCCLPVGARYKLTKPSTTRLHAQQVTIPLSHCLLLEYQSDVMLMFSSNDSVFLHLHARKEQLSKAWLFVHAVSRHYFFWLSEHSAYQFNTHRCIAYAINMVIFLQQYNSARIHYDTLLQPCKLLCISMYAQYVVRSFPYWCLSCTTSVFSNSFTHMFISICILV